MTKGRFSKAFVNALVLDLYKRHKSLLKTRFSVLEYGYAVDFLLVLIELFC